MSNIEITLYGRVPSKKNSRNIFARGGKLFNIPSKKYKEWNAAASAQLKEQDIVEITSIIESITIHLFAPDKRASDLTNKAESILDLLVDNEIIKDDNWFIVPNVHLCFSGIDRKNPRCIVNIALKGSI